MEILGITLTAWSALVVTISAGVIAGVMLVVGSNRLHFIWGAFCLAVFVYAAGFFMVASVGDPESARFWWKIDYIGTILSPFIFLHFVLTFLKRGRLWTIAPLYITSLVLIYLNLKTDLIINEVTFMFGELYYNSPPGLLHPLLVGIYILLITYAHYLLVRAYRASKDSIFRTQVRYFFIATSSGFIGGFMNFIAVYGIPLHPATQLTILIAMPLIGFAILRYQLFGVRAVWAQFLAFILSSFAFIQLILSDSRQKIIINSVLLVFVLVVGVYLVRSVRKEVESREQIQKLARDLKKANARLRELDKQKSEFVSIASHQLRSPLTAIKGYASMLLEGSFSNIPAKNREPIERILKSSKRLVSVVEDFLNITRIEQGRMRYDPEILDVNDLVGEIVEELEPNIHSSGLSIKLTKIKNNASKINADRGKIRQVIINLIDNAIKYTPKGSIIITISSDINTKKIGIDIADTGIGFPEKFKANMFEKFSRADNSKKIHADGSGIGLYMAHEIVGAHKGRIWAESAGNGKGSTFHIELPLVIT